MPLTMAQADPAMRATTSDELATCDEMEGLASTMDTT